MRKRVVKIHVCGGDGVRVCSLWVGVKVKICRNMCRGDIGMRGRDGLCILV